ncbi:hypothetical protein [Desulfovibrio sp.]|uniref:hypothetical protein n=1 Tax=Desulfovibrio sp. TaxID=885 RepID=UPI003077B947
MSLFINTSNKAPMSIDLIELSLKTTWAAFTDAVAKAEDAGVSVTLFKKDELDSLKDMELSNIRGLKLGAHMDLNVM